MARKNRDSAKASTPQSGSLALRRRTPLNVPNASGVAALGDGRLLVVDDKKGIFLVAPDGAPSRITRAKGKAQALDLEGITFDPNRGEVVVVCENDGSVRSFPLLTSGKTASLGAARALGKLPAIGKEDNKGWEGIAWAADGALAPGEHVLAVHERKPKRIGVFTYPALETVVLLELPKQAKDALRDLSDVAFDAGTGHIWILSDESSCLVELSLAGLGTDSVSLAIEGIHPVEVGKREKPEGVCIDGDVLRLVTDGEPYLYALELRKP